MMLSCARNTVLGQGSREGTVQMWESRCMHTNNDDEHVHTTYLLLLGSTVALLLLHVYFCHYYMFLRVHHQHRMYTKKSSVINSH
jgi:hypothetical protein